MLGSVQVRFPYNTVKELARYKLDSVGLHEVRCDKVDTVRVGGLCFFFFLWKKKRKSEVNADKTNYVDMS